MANFYYEALDMTGKKVKGTIEAEVLAEAMDSLSSQGIIPLKVKEQKGGSKGGSKAVDAGGEKTHWYEFTIGSPVTTDDMVIFSRQFRSMYNAGVPVLRVIQILRDQTENKAMRMVIAAMEKDINSGAALNEAMAKHPKVFSHLYCSMVKSGEMSGSIPDVLDRLSYILAHESKIRQDIKSAMQYPIVVTVALSGAFFFLLAFVIPKFAAIFEKAKLNLPLPTVIAMNLHKFLIGYWYVMAAIAITVVVSLHLFFKTEAGMLMRDKNKLRIPILGPLFVKAAMSRFASIFAILYSSGVPVLSALTILAEVFENAFINKIFKAASVKVEQGKGISEPLSESGFFPPMVTAMVAIGEETGNMDAMLREITNHYDEEVRVTTARLADLITPVLTVALAVVVGFFALAIFMPMWDLTKMAKQK